MRERPALSSLGGGKVGVTVMPALNRLLGQEGGRGRGRGVCRWCPCTEQCLNHYRDVTRQPGGEKGYKGYL